jgi:hypothetical protein
MIRSLNGQTTSGIASRHCLPAEQLFQFSKAVTKASQRFFGVLEKTSLSVETGRTEELMRVDSRDPTSLDGVSMTVKRTGFG